MNKRYRCVNIQNMDYFLNNLEEDERIVSVFIRQIAYRDMGEIEYSWVTQAIIERIDKE